jgi:hypothetical protein
MGVRVGAAQASDQLGHERGVGRGHGVILASGRRICYLSGCAHARFLAETGLLV